MTDPIDESSLLKLYGLTTLDPQQWEDPPSGPEAGDDALVALSLSQTPVLGHEDGTDGGGRREMEDPLGLKMRLEISQDTQVPHAPLSTSSNPEPSAVAPTLLSSKQFSPPAFLSTYHPEASFQDLQRGAEILKRNVEERGEEVRILVEREFGRFVAVKGSTDAALRDIKVDLLAEGSDHGTREIRETIKVTSHRAETLFLPLLSNAMKAQKLKSTLGIFERSKFLFGLPRVLRMNVRAGKYEAALREYHKGLYLYNNRPNQLLPVSIPQPSTGNQSLVPPSTTTAKPPDNLFSPIEPSQSPITPSVPQPGGGSLSDAQIHARREQQKRLVRKIWGEVEKVMAEMRGRLEDGLRGVSGDEAEAEGMGRVELGIEEVEKSIEILLELNPKEDPVWLYLDSQHRYILGKMRSVYNKRVKQLEVVKASENMKPLDDTARAGNLKRCIDKLMANDADPEFEIGKCDCLTETRVKSDLCFAANSAGGPVWIATFEVVRAVSAVLIQTVPEFWKICRGYKEGKYRRKNITLTSDELATGFLRCRKMTLDIVKLYISLLGQFFSLSDISIASARPAGQSPSQSSLGQAAATNGTSLPDFVPGDANSLITCDYAGKILSEIVESAGEIDALTAGNPGGSSTTSADLGQEAKKAMRDFVESCRWRLEEAICETWSRDAKEFFRQEDWTVNPAKIGTTMYLEKIGSLQKHNATVAWQVAGGSTEYGADKSAVPAVFVNKIKECFLDSLYYFLDGMVHLALSGEEPLFAEASLQNHGIDWHDRDTRIILTMSNIHHLQTELLPTMLSKFEVLYGLKSVDDKNTLRQVIEQVDDVLFRDYLKRKREMLQNITDAGLLGPGVDPLTEVRPSDVRPYMLKDLLCLVDAHAHVTILAPALAQRIIETLVRELAHALLRAFSQIHEMGLGAMLSATLEVEFLDRSLLPYVNQEAMDVLNDIYASISQAYAAYKEGPAGLALGADNLNQELENLKQVLLDARRATGVQFICFRKQQS